MTWIKKGETQTMTACGCEVSIEKKNGKYCAICYKTVDGKQTVVRKYRPRKNIGILKLIVENDDIFKETGKSPLCYESEVELAYWQK